MVANVAARHEGRIDETPVPQARQGFTIVVEMVGLAPDGPLPVDAEPGEVAEDRLLVTRFGPRQVDVLDAQQDPSAFVGRQAGVQHRRERMAKMQEAIRRRGETENRAGHGWGIAFGWPVLTPRVLERKCAL
jgi:hypothetical protein